MFSHKIIIYICVFLLVNGVAYAEYSCKEEALYTEQHIELHNISSSQKMLFDSSKNDVSSSFGIGRIIGSMYSKSILKVILEDVSNKRNK